MEKADVGKASDGTDVLDKLARLERENRKLSREVLHLKNAIVQEKTASTTALNQHKASTFIQRERERYLALLLANSPSIILFLSQAGRIEFYTEYFIAKAGFKSATEVQGHSLTEIFSPFLDSASHEKLLELSHKVIQTKAPLTFDATFHFNQDGPAEDFAGILVPMEDAQQNTSGMMLMLHDITDLKRSREEALAASRAKSAFLSNMSHEIRTPMNAIIGMTSIGKNESDVRRKDYAFGKIESASKHLLGVINDILDISKIETGKMELSHITFSFAEMINRVVNVTALRMQSKHQHFTVEIDPEIPEYLYGDDQRLAQVITNILSNATKFTPENGSIIFNAKLLNIHDGMCAIQMFVKDSGIGISSQEQGKLFNIFQQAEAGTSRKYGGSGLGLALSKRILELMDGKIWIESEAGKGSCFFFTVSLGIPDHVELTKNIEHGAISDENDLVRDFSGKTVLLVDDIDINLEIVAALLEPTHIVIDTAKSGKEAVDAFVAHPERYDLILMDMQMPEMDGLQATRTIRALGTPQAATIPIIAMTANVFKEDIEKCVDAGMNDHLGKPIEMTCVMDMLSRYLKAK